MIRTWVVGSLVLGLVAAPVLGQTGGTDDSSSNTSLADQSPSENVRSAAVQARAPGTVVDNALTRHRDRASARLAAQRGASTSELAAEDDSGDGTTGSTSGLGDLGSLLGSLGGIDLSSILGGLTGGTGGSGTNGNVLGGGNSTGSGGSNVPSNITPEAIALLESFGFNVGDLFAGDSTGTTNKALDPTDDTIDLTAQASDATQQKFGLRWANAMLSALFTGFAQIVRSSAVVDNVAQAFAPLFEDNSQTTTDSDEATSKASHERPLRDLLKGVPSRVFLLGA